MMHTFILNCSTTGYSTGESPTPSVPNVIDQVVYSNCCVLQLFIPPDSRVIVLKKMISGRQCD